jgi:hypothetical protein
MMKVRCLARELTDEQKAWLRITTPSTPEYQLVVGNSYLVLGITFVFPMEPHGGGLQYQVLNDYGACRSIPACLFEVEDGRSSQYWLAKQESDGSLLLWPEEFFVRYFHDDLSEGEADAMQAFQRVVVKMQAEFASN